MQTSSQLSRYISVSALLMGLLLPTLSNAFVVSTFTGGDAGEGLDFEGDFDYAVNFGGPAGLTIQGLSFSDSTAPGVTLSAQVEGQWNAAPPNYGPTANDLALTTLSNEIAVSVIASGNLDVTITLDNLIIGEQYKMQSIFYEQTNNRGFAVTLNGVLLVDDFNPGAESGGPGNNIGTLLSDTLTATSTSLVLTLTQSATAFPDPNPMISAITLEHIPQPAPIPSTLLLLMVSACIPLLRHKKKKRRSTTRSIA